MEPNVKYTLMVANKFQDYSGETRWEIIMEENSSEKFFPYIFEHGFEINVYQIQMKREGEITQMIKVGEFESKKLEEIKNKKLGKLLINTFGNIQEINELLKS